MYDLTWYTNAIGWKYNDKTLMIMCSFLYMKYFCIYFTRFWIIYSRFIGIQLIRIRKLLDGFENAGSYLIWCWIYIRFMGFNMLHTHQNKSSNQTSGLLFTDGMENSKSFNARQFSCQILTMYILYPSVKREMLMFLKFILI